MTDLIERWTEHKRKVFAIEPLFSSNDSMGQLIDDTIDEIERLQARVEVLEKVRKAVLTHRDNKEFLNIDTWNACVYAAEAATEQGESDD